MRVGFVLSNALWLLTCERAVGANVLKVASWARIGQILGGRRDADAGTSLKDSRNFVQFASEASARKDLRPRASAGLDSIEQCK